MASKAYIDGVKTLAERELADTDVAELVSAMAGGWNAQLIVEAPAPAPHDVAAITLALSAAARHTGARYVCVYPDRNSAAEHPAEVVVGEAAEAMGGLEGVDLLVVDARRGDAAAAVAAARPGPRGMVVVQHHAGRRRGCGGGGVALVPAGKRVVRAAYLPIGKGVEVLHVGVGKGPSLSGGGGGGGRPSRWIRHVDRDTGEEHVFRR
ncbi:hypothetical protein ACMD2_02335 [Ananas comosus]|uniref:Uncharacterized protein n=1 Tax=Ananas comosus TaxID=4615 RepID=A0A199VBX5_ANACO|nr:hypothetical protein ACMD2_02335 [Ananas comosus]